MGLVASDKTLADQLKQSPSAGEISDEKLILQIADGSREALALLFRRYARSVHAISSSILRNKAEADDFLQDIFLSINSEAQSFDSTRGSAHTWILQMVYRRAISRRRHLNCRHFYTAVNIDDVIENGQGPQTASSALEDVIDEQIAIGNLESVFHTLSENQRQTLRLFFIEGYTFDEIATKLGQSRGNIKHHYFRGLETLRKELFGSKLPGERAI